MLCTRRARAAPARPSAFARTVARARPAPTMRLRRFYSSDKNPTLPNDSSLQRIRDPFEGISAQPFPKEVAERLMQRIPANDIEIRPDGLIYLPEIKYRRILNAAIGPGGWALMPRAETMAREENSYSREFALFCFGRFVAQARGEQGISERGGALNLGFLDEAAKSNALMRCCKDIGVASELWDPQFISEWKTQMATDVWCENVKTGDKRKFWRRKDRPAISFPWKEVSGQAPSNVEAPPVVAADTPAAFADESIGAESTPVAAAQRSTSGGGNSSGSGSQARSSRSSNKDAELAKEFDMQAIVPEQLKKIAGKTWLEATSSEEGRRYLMWVIGPDAKVRPTLKTMAKKALDGYQALSKFEGPDKAETTAS